MEDYLKVIYAVEESGDRVATQTIAERLNVAAPSVTGMLKRLAELKLVEHEPYRATKLTPAGRKIALEVVRHHRLLELYLAEALGYSWDEVHAEADRLEHTISEAFEARIDAALGYPTHDPHGDPIPSRSGDIVAVSEDRLSTLETGCAATVVRVPDDDPEKLRYLGQLGLYPNAVIRVIERMPFNGPLRIDVVGSEHIIAVDLAAGVHVRAAADESDS
jgi:DtxR family Mn-dependent transcriptional regulator